MLNEIMEYNHYLSISEAKYNDDYFMTYSTLENGTGLNHILEVIARGELFSNSGTFESAEKAIRDWLYSFRESDRLFSICDNNAEKHEKIKKAIGSKGLRWSNQTFNQNDYDDYYKATFQALVANAYALGPLKEYVLLAKRDIFEDESAIVKIIGDGPDKTFKKATAAEQDYLLKLTSTFLINNQGINQESVKIIDAVVYNWACREKKINTSFYFNKDVSSIAPEELNNSYIPIYTKITLPEINNYKKITFNKEWIDNYKIIDISELDNTEGLNYQLYYKDTGLTKEEKTKRTKNGTDYIKETQIVFSFPLERHYL